MKPKLLICLLVLLVGVPLMAAPPAGKSAQSTALTVDNVSFIAANRIYMFVTNHGNFGRDLGGVFGNDYGTYFPYTSDADIRAGKTQSPYYAGGLWIGGVDSATNDTLIVVSEYSSEYVPGPSLAGDFQADRPEFKVYKLFKDSLASNPNADYTNWPWDQGAPVAYIYDVDTTVVPWDSTLVDSIPGRIGDQMAWTVFNDFDPDQHDNNNGETEPLGIDIKQTIFAFERTSGALANIVFLRWQVYNTGSKTLDSCFFSIWSDPDLGTSGDDLVGCDPTLGLGYTYNATNQDNKYAAAIPPIVPAIGLDFFQGPLIETGDLSDSAKMWGKWWYGYENMGLYSFNKYINGTDPDNYAETYQYMLGLDPKNGAIPFIDPTTGLESKFVMSGDPVTGTGWLDAAPDDRRMMLTTGPITFRPGDSTEILAAIVVGQGGDYLSSITVMKGIDAYAQKLYDLDFQPPEPPARPVVTAYSAPGAISLSWTDTSEVDPGDYEFQGYTLWQGASASGPWTLIKTWDIVDDYVGGMIDTIFVADAGQPLPVSMRAVGNTDLGYSYNFTRDMITGNRLYDVTEYYYKVSAFAWGLEFRGSPVTAGDHFLESETIITAIPQSPVAGTYATVGTFDTLAVTHVGPADGACVPMVFEPAATTGHTYQVTFSTDALLGPVWHLLDVTLGDTLLLNQTNQSGNDDYFVKDGLLVKVTGPAPGVKTGSPIDNPDEPSIWGWDIPAGTRRFTWASASGFAWEGFGGAIGWGGPGDTHGFGEADPVDPALLPDVLLRLATVSADGTYDVNDTNVSYGYRYMRNCQNPPALPQFAPYIINTGATYDFQAFEQNVPLSAWNVSVDPPQRLVVGFLENNADLALSLDGKWFPLGNDSLTVLGTDNTASGGPREWLWIYLDDYSTTADAAYTGNAIDDPMPIMYWLTVARRGNAAFSPDSSGQDQFLIISSKVNSATDTYTFTAPAPLISAEESDLDAIKAVPNPFYLYGPYDPAVGNYQIKFHHLPQVCTISIYNLAGDFIAQIDKNDDTPFATWNLQSDSRIPVASGIYIYVVDAPGFGTKIGKLAVFYEQEVLTIY